mgnify:CR=1 FL=1
MTLEERADLIADHCSVHGAMRGTARWTRARGHALAQLREAVDEARVVAVKNVVAALKANTGPGK